MTVVEKDLFADDRPRLIVRSRLKTIAEFLRKEQRRKKNQKDDKTPFHSFIINGKVPPVNFKTRRSDKKETKRRKNENRFYCRQ